MTPDQFHRRHLKWQAKFDPDVPDTPEGCWYCGRNQAACRSKRTYFSLQEALNVITEINHPGRDRLVVAYGSCPWLDQKHWHLTTARRSSDRRRARKRMAKEIRLEFEKNPPVRVTARWLP